MEDEETETNLFVCVSEALLPEPHTDLLLLHIALDFLRFLGADEITIPGGSKQPARTERVGRQQQHSRIDKLSHC